VTIHSRKIAVHRQIKAISLSCARGLPVRNPGLIIRAAFFFAVIFSLSSVARAQVAPAAKATTGPDHLSIGGNVPKPFTLSIDDLRKLPHKTIQVMNAHEKKQETYEGVLLSDLLDQAGAPKGEAIRGALMTTYVIAEGADSYRSLFSLAELDSGFEDSGVLVAYSLDGAPMAGDIGPLRLVVPNDKRPARWVRMLASITVGAVAARPTN
jgi:DMSO/TMAO reductase YedYZ molybdopterin-dependent catalytic subunit